MLILFIFCIILIGDNMIDKILLVAFVVVVIFVVHFFTNLFFKKVILNRVSKRKETIFLLGVNFIKYGGLLVGLFIILAIFGVDTASVLAGAGLLGILLGFGLQKLMQDMINGFFIIFENQYVAGEYVCINGSDGLVEELGLKTTRIATYKGEIHFISNGDIKTVINYSRNNSLAIIDLPVLHKYSYSSIIKIIETVIKKIKHHNIISVPRILGIQRIEEISYTIRIVCETKPFEYFSTDFGIPQAVAGFNPLDILMSVYMILRQIDQGEPRIDNEYKRALKASDNKPSYEVNYNLNIFFKCFIEI